MSPLAQAGLVALALVVGLVVAGALSAVATVIFVMAAARRMARETERRARAAPLAPLPGRLEPLAPAVRILAARRPSEPVRVPFRGKEGAAVDVEGGTFQHTTGTAATGVVTATDLGFEGKGEKGNGET